MIAFSEFQAAVRSWDARQPRAWLPPGRHVRVVGAGSVSPVGVTRLGGIGARPRVAPNVRVLEIPKGPEGTVATLRAMRGLAILAARDPYFVAWAQAIPRLAGVAARDYEGELAAVHDAVRDHVGYQLDPRGLEWLQAPAWTLFVRGAGDCDDHACLLAGLSLALGHGAAFRAIKADRARAREFSHVYALLGARVKGEEKWWPSDTTLPGRSLGFEAIRAAIAPPLDLVVAAA